VTSDLWDGIAARTADRPTSRRSTFFRIDKDGQLAEHRDRIDWVRVYRSFGMLPDDIQDF
jgi:hypothetical protein